MKQNDVLLYWVEGETEKKIITAIKNEFILSGKIDIVRISENKISDMMIRMIKPNTNIIIVFDTDVNQESNIKTLDKNIERLKKVKNVRRILLIP